MNDTNVLFASFFTYNQTWGLVHPIVISITGGIEAIFGILFIYTRKWCVGTFVGNISWCVVNKALSHVVLHIYLKNGVLEHP